MFVLIFLTTDRSRPLELNDVRVRRLLRNSYFTAELERVSDRLRHSTFRDLDIPYMITRLTDGRFSRDEILFVFEIVHQYAFQALSNFLWEIGYPTQKKRPKSTEREFWEPFFDAVSERQSDVNDFAYYIAASARKERVMGLLAAGHEGILATNLVALLSDFPGNYLRRIETLVFPDWRAACFSRSWQNSSMWGHYADGHKGVCLVFDTCKDKNGNQCIPFIDTEDPTKCKLLICHNVVYDELLPEIDFFPNIGTISNKEMFEDWYTNDEGEISASAPNVTNKYTLLRRRTEIVARDVLHKTVDWRYENEVRLIVEGSDGRGSPRQARQKFDLRSLHGIIFGMNVSRSDMLAVYRRVKSVGERIGHSGLVYYDAYYDFRSGKIDCLVGGVSMKSQDKHKHQSDVRKRR